MQRETGHDELASRCRRASRMMEEAELDLVLATTEPELRWLCGFHTPFWQSPTRPWFVLLDLAGDVHAVIPAIGEVCMKKGRTASIRTWTSPAPADEGVTLLAGRIGELAGPHARIGISCGPETHLRMPLGDHARLLGLLPDVTWQDATPLWQRLVTIKGEAEIGRIAIAAGRTCDAFDALFPKLRPGLSEREVFRMMRMEALSAGLDEIPYLVGGAGPGGYGDIISPPGDRALADGDVLMLDTGATFDGYFCDFDRNFAIGLPDDAVRSAYARVHEALEAGLEAARPGIACCELFGAMQSILVQGGGGDGAVGRLGHGVGIQLTEWPSITAGDRTVLEPGMVLALEPGLAFGDRKAMVHEENIVVRDKGAELLTRRAPAEIPVVR